MDTQFAKIDGSAISQFARDRLAAIRAPSNGAISRLQREVIDHEVARHSATNDFWAHLNARIDGHIERGAQHEAEIDRVLVEMARDGEAQATFIERWNAMSYDEAVAFMAGAQ